MPPSILELRERELIEKDPVYARMSQDFEKPKVPQTLVAGEFVPDHRGHIHEVERINKNIGRYPVGFRHYENFHNYQLKFPERDMTDYIEDSKLK